MCTGPSVGGRLSRHRVVFLVQPSVTSSITTRHVCPVLKVEVTMERISVSAAHRNDTVKEPRSYVADSILITVETDYGLSKSRNFARLASLFINSISESSIS